MNETIPDKGAYETNRRRMCWAALGRDDHLHGCDYLRSCTDVLGKKHSHGAVSDTVWIGRCSLCAKQ